MPVVRSLKVSAQGRDPEPSPFTINTDVDKATGEDSYRSTSTTKRPRATKSKKDSVRKKKPSNAFFLLRSHIISNNLIPRGSHQNAVSIEVARLWRESSEETRRYFFRKAEMEKERHDAEVCGSGMSVEFSEASTSGSVWRVTSPRVHQHGPAPALSPSPSISALPSPAPPTPESTLCLDLPQYIPSDATGAENLLSYNDDLSCWAPKMQTKPLPQISTIYPSEVDINPELLPFAYPSLNLLPSEFEWSADMSSSELTPHPQYYVPDSELNNTLECWFPFNPCMPSYSFP